MVNASRCLRSPAFAALLAAAMPIACMSCLSCLLTWAAGLSRPRAFCEFQLRLPCGWRSPTWAKGFCTAEGSGESRDGNPLPRLATRKQRISDVIASVT